MANVYIGLGSNLGDRKKNITNATVILGSVMGDIKILSSIYETKPWGFSSDNLFLNAVILIETDCTPETCLQMAKRIEEEMGRTYAHHERYEDRVIDIDILLYDDITIHTENLTIPHPLIQERKFVLQPLSEIAPELIHPVLNKPIKDLLEELEKK
ncbi:MAG: 2-amino-4-hydroxy-6-hydroxymethyldihydropteridine diphosphokinase [Paludibacteraceae bacterium]|nr:2-amino-4-hydroxy-6-hydroxymethyldihydropteridine diphosphokinase [Paludibacteraceae bacterium]MEE3483449.1 2-amino-4-hydroxy-6-hydroxymethyldihydropteridine diphosphokinase [Bacteroidales bacterium]